MSKLPHDHKVDFPDFNKEGARLLGMAVRALICYRAHSTSGLGDSAAKHFFGALDANDISAAYLATLEPLSDLKESHSG